MNRRSAVIFYILSVYVIVQFLWWGFHLLQLTKEVVGDSGIQSRRITMILGEGGIFIVLLFIGLWQIKRTIKKEIQLARRQKNFLLSVTHELKTPLAANKLYLQTLIKRDLERSKQLEMLDNAVKENSRLEQMIDNILNATRLENNTLIMEHQNVDLSELSRVAVERFRVLTDKEMLIELQSNIHIKGDPFLLETMMNNLIDNAIKYGGEKIQIYCRKEKDMICFGVIDDGSGISKEMQQEIFKKFYRGGDEETRSTKGTGLGLFIVSEIAKLHKGSIRFIEEPKGGSHFQITLHDNER